MTVYDQALPQLERAAELTPDDADLVYNQACSSARLGDADGAMQHLRRAFELEPDRFRFHAGADADLESLRQRSDFEQLLSRPKPDLPSD